MPVGTKWVRRVAEVFDTRPRIGSSKKTIWLERKEASNRFANAFYRLGAHVCLDGPTGAGKTSLGLTHLVDQKLRHVSIQLTAEMDWEDFCRQIAAPPSNEETSLSSELELGVDKWMPIAKFRVALGEKSRASDDVELLQKMAASWSEHDVARRLAERDAVLFVDDVERASDSLLKRLADLSRLLTQTYPSENAKIVFVGSGDIYQRLYDENPALEERLTQVSLGGFRDRHDSVLLLIRGFSELGLRHPWNSRIPRERAQSEDCRNAVWEAADGLPKSLNRLGFEIAFSAESRSGISGYDIIEKAKKMTEDHWVQYAQRFPEVVDYLYVEPLAIEVVRHIYLEGIARIHTVPHLIQRIQHHSSASSTRAVEKAIDGLARLDFLIVTGRTGELIFVKHPTAAHTLGVAMRDPSRFRRVHELQVGRPSLQLAFPLPFEREHLEDMPSDDA